MSQCDLYEILPSGERSLFQEYGNANAGQYLIWELLRPILDPSSSSLDNPSWRRMLEAIKGPEHTVEVRVAMAITHERSWIRKDHLPLAIRALRTLGAMVPPQTRSHLINIANDLECLDPQAVGVYFHWYSGVEDHAVRRGGSGRVECNFLDPVSLETHGIIEAFEQIPDLA